jgi:serine/threonine-protein kinase
MDFIRGRPIDAYCTEHRLDIPARLTLFRALCAAVQYVHQHLMVHGDLKCDNILVTDDGTVKLLDFGIAKLLNPSPALSRPDAKLTGADSRGTVHYGERRVLAGRGSPSTAHRRVAAQLRG